MPGNFLKSPPRPSRRHLMFSLLQEEDEPDWLENDMVTNNLAVSHDDLFRNERQLFSSEFFSSEENHCQEKGNDDGTKSTISIGDSSYEETAESGNNCDAKICITAEATSPSRKRNYPILAPLSPTANSICSATDNIANAVGSTSNDNAANAGFDNDREFELFSIQVEMAKSAFLRDPCQERWMDLVHSFHMQKFRELMSDNDSDEDTTTDPNSFAHYVNQNGMKNPENDIEIGLALSRLENSLVVLEEKAMHAFYQNDVDVDINADIFCDDFLEDWSDEQDVSPSSSVFLRNKENEDTSIPSPSGSEYNPDCFGGEEKSKEVQPDQHNKNSAVDANEDTLITSNVAALTKASGPKTARATIRATAVSKLESKTTRSSRVQNEVLHWEKRIVRYDQRYVNIVAAALDEAQGASWKIGQIVEVVPSSSPGCGGGGDGSSSMDASCNDDSDEEILYVV